MQTPEDAGPDAAADSGLKPSAMRGPEALYGYVVALELIVVAILNLTVRHGKGAPAHPQTSLSVVGIAAAVAFVAVIQTKNRWFVSFAAMIAAFFVTLPRTPQTLSLAHIFALAIPLAYAIILTQRQRRATAAAGRARPARAANGGPARQDRRSRGRAAERKAPVPTGPQASRRYTPPKARRGRSR